jgi:hypothetical protein
MAPRTQHACVGIPEKFEVAVGAADAKTLKVPGVTVLVRINRSGHAEQALPTKPA